MGRNLMPQLREESGKDFHVPMQDSGRPNFKAAAWQENGYQKGFWGKEFQNSMASDSREIDSICFDIHTNWICTYRH